MKLFDRMRDIQMTKEEKDALRSHIFAYMQSYPLPEGATVTGTLAGNLFWGRLFMRAVPAFLILLLMGGVASAAEGTIPGDVLYGVKVNVTEKMRTAFALDERAKAHVAVTLAERRLQEAAKLATQGKLDEDVRVELEVRFKKHAEEAKVKIGELGESRGAESVAEVSAELESSLAAHSKVLVEIGSASDEDIQAFLFPLVSAVDVEVNAASEVRQQAEFDAVQSTIGISRVTAENKREDVEEKILEARKFIDKNQLLISEEARLQAGERVAGAEQLIIDGNASLERERAGDAFILFQKALGITQEVMVILEANKTLDVRVDFTVNSNAGTSTDEQVDEQEEDGNEDGATSTLPVPLP